MAWNDTGATLKGPKGDPGPKGDTGPKGADSTVPGPKGDTGAKGATGAKGDTGERGSKWFYGASNPTTVSGAIAGDMYLNTATGQVFQLV